MTPAYPNYSQPHHSPPPQLTYPQPFPAPHDQVAAQYQSLRIHDEHTRPSFAAQHGYVGGNSAHISSEDPSGSDIMFTLHNQAIVSDLQVDLGEEEFDPAEDTYCGINVTKTQPDSPTHGQTSLQNDMKSFPQPSSDPEEHNKRKKGSFAPASSPTTGHKGPVPVPIRKRLLVRPHKKFAENSIGLQTLMGPLPLSPLTSKEPRPPKKGDFGQG